MTTFTRLSAGSTCSALQKTGCRKRWRKSNVSTSSALVCLTARERLPVRFWRMNWGTGFFSIRLALAPNSRFDQKQRLKNYTCSRIMPIPMPPPMQSAARPSGYPVKINVVAIRGMNDDEIIDFARLTDRRPYHVRFSRLAFCVFHLLSFVANTAILWHATCLLIL